MAITGAGYLFATFSLKYISSHCAPEQMSALASIDAYFQLIVNIISMGLQASAIRHIATSSDWKKEYERTQIARITMGLLILLPICISFSKPDFSVFILAPLVASSGDYALYARGYPIYGSWIAFFRTSIPFICSLAFVASASNTLTLPYLIGLLLTYVITNFSISISLGVKSFFAPKLRSLKLYLQTLSLSVINLSFYFLGLGLLIPATYLYNSENISIAFIALKFYVIYKGVLRIIHQAFVKDMINNETCLKIDQLSFLFGIVFLGSILFFPVSFITLFFGEQFVVHKNFFIIISMAAVSYSLFLSMATKAVLDKKETTLTKLSLSSSLITLLLLFLLPIFNYKDLGIAFSLLSGELILSFGLALLFLERHEIFERIRHYGTSTIFIVIFAAGKIFFHDNFSSYFISLTIFAALFMLLNYNKFKEIKTSGDNQ